MNYYHIDSFTKELFKGNPAGVCILEKEWPTDQTMMDMAAENRHSETAFVLYKEEKYHIRWFAPLSEIYLCGHATLAAAYALFEGEKVDQEKIEFHSNRGILTVVQSNLGLTMDFPLCTLGALEYQPIFDECFKNPPKEVYQANADILFVYDTVEDITDCGFDLAKIAQVPGEGIIITAKGEDCDFVSRCFCPQVGIDEDPVTGSAHTALVSYWKPILGKETFFAKQLSPRGGEMTCEIQGDRVLLSGSAVLYMKGEITL